ncbi:MAG: DUF937 domain-containing protein [Clostridiales bacterium]|nr:DUF937 domain-containing protein [Clostridiales bacterium]
MDLVSTILKSMTSTSSLGVLAGKTGLSADSIEKALASAIPSLVGNMTKNASSAAGAKSLLGALAQHEDKSDVSSQLENADETDGNKIIGKIMGDDKDDFISSIAKKAGINFDQSSAILSNIAPSLLSSISAAAKPDTEESVAKEAAERKAKAEKDSSSFIGGFLKNFMKDPDDKDAKTGIDGTDLLNILKNTML